MRLHAIGFGSLNLDEFWEVPGRFLLDHHLEPGREYVKDLQWFSSVYPILREIGALKGRDPGGSAANMIAALRRMGFDTGFYGVTGMDDVEAMRLDELGSPENLAVRKVSVPAGRCLALIDRDDPQRDRALVILPNANDLAGVDVPEPDYFCRALWVHITSFVSGGPLEAQARLIARLPAEVRVSFDPGALYVSRGLRELEPLLRRTNVLFLAAEELETLTAEKNRDKALARLTGLGVGTVVVKMGTQGIAAARHGAFIHQGAVPPRRILDRTGAGDVAAAGFIAGLIEGLPIDKCLALAAQCASRSIEGYGRSTYPEGEEVREFRGGPFLQKGASSDPSTKNS